MKPIHIALFFFVFSLHSMEEREFKTNHQIPIELKLRIILFYAQLLNYSKFENFLAVFTSKIRNYADIYEIFNKDIVFNQKLITILRKKFVESIPFRIVIPYSLATIDEGQLICIAAKLGTIASLQILQEKYKQNSNFFIAVLIVNLSSMNIFCTKELFEFARDNFDIDNMKELVLFRFPKRYTILFQAVRLNKPNIMKLILNIAQNVLTNSEKDALFNATVHNRTALDLAKAYEAQFQFQETENWQENRLNLVNSFKIVLLLQKAGVKERTQLKIQT